MSEPQSHYLRGVFDFHRRETRAPEAIYTAFLDTFTSPSGRIVLEALFDAWCMRQIADERGIGLHDAWLYIVDAMAQGEGYRTRKEGWVKDDR